MRAIREFFHTAFFRDASILQVGGFVQFAISFMGSITVARLLGPDGYGAFALAGALAGFFGLGLDAGQGQTVLVHFSRAYAAGEREEAARVAAFYVKATILIWICIGVPLFLAAGWLGNALYTRPDIGWYVRLLLVASAISSVTALFSLLLQVARRVTALGIMESLDQFLKSGAMALGAWTGLGVGGVAAGQATGAAASSIASLVLYRSYARRDALLPHIRSILARAWNVSLRQYLRFSITIAAAKNLGELHQIGIMFFLGRLASPQDAAFFKIAISYMTLAFFPLGAVSRLLQDQFPKDQVRDPAVLRNHFIKVSFISGAAAAVLGVFLMLLGPFLVGIVYGRPYAGTVPLIQALWWYTAVVGFGIGLGSLYRTLNRLSFAIKLQIGTLTIGMPLSFLLVRMYGPVGAVYGITLMKGLETIIAFSYGLSLLRLLKKGRLL